MAGEITEVMQNEANNLGAEIKPSAPELPKFPIMIDGKSHELPMYVANGKISSKTDIIDLETEEPTGAFMIHNFSWQDEKPFVERETSSKTQLKQIGRSKDQEIDTAHRITVNGKLYCAIIGSGELHIPKGNSQFDAQPISREQMVKHGQIYPESADEAVESFINIPKVMRFSDSTAPKNFDFLFSAPEQIQILWLLGSKANPSYAGLFTFKSPSSEEREAYDDAVQKITSKRRGDMSIAEIEENFVKKIQYGAKHLLKVDGIVYTDELKPFSKDVKALNDFIVNFGPLWFAEIIDKMHDSFGFMKAKQETT